MNCKPYHGGFKKGKRSEIQTQWMNGVFPVLIATCAFGMGVDKATVRVVVNWNVPERVSTYYQESGRCGRDGKQSFSRIYYGKEDIDKICFLLSMNATTSDIINTSFEQNDTNTNANLAEFYKIMDMCENVTCRHTFLSEYFGDEAPQCINSCDSCADEDGTLEKLNNFLDILEHRTDGLGQMELVPEDIKAKNIFIEVPATVDGVRCGPKLETSYMMENNRYITDHEYFPSSNFINIPYIKHTNRISVKIKDADEKKKKNNIGNSYAKGTNYNTNRN